MGWRMLEGDDMVCPGPRDTKNKLTLRKRHVFVIEKYVEDVTQDEKHVPDLLESIMKPNDPVKEELRLANPFEKNNIFHPYSQAQALARARPPAQAWAPAKKDGKYKRAAKQ